MREEKEREEPAYIPAGSRQQPWMQLPQVLGNCSYPSPHLMCSTHE